MFKSQAEMNQMNEKIQYDVGASWVDVLSYSIMFFLLVFFEL